MKRSDVQKALATFDQQFRSLPEWTDWDKKRSQKYAIAEAGKLYPPKRIISIATNTPVKDLMGGRPSNGALQGLGFTIVPLQAKAPLPVDIPDFIVGREYQRSTEITGRFGGSSRSGIAPSARVPAVFLFTGGNATKFGYEDTIEPDGVLNYCGEGQVGDMRMIAGNAAIANHAAHGNALHVFRNNGKSKPCTYLGEFFYGSHYTKRAPDRDGADREIIVFRLVPVGTAQVEQTQEDSALETSSNLSLEELRARALAAVGEHPPSNNPRSTTRTAYRRSLDVKLYVLARAAGICELCDQAAPFISKATGEPYLEPHHVNRLSDDGLDHPTYMGAICPTCHTRIHLGVGGRELNEQLRQRVALLEES